MGNKNFNVLDSLTDKVVVITGATRGIGKELAEAFLDVGSKIAFCARNETDLEGLRSSLIKDTKSDVYSEQCDVSDYGQVEKFMKNVSQYFGQIDIVVNNAALGYFNDFDKLNHEEWNNMFNVNVNGVYNVTKTALQYLKKNKTIPKAYIFILGSISHNTYVKGNSGYSSTKAALRSLSEHLYNELRTEDIQVTYLAPGSVRTGFSGRYAQNDEWKIEPESIAQIMVDVASSAFNGEDYCITYLEIKAKKPIKVETYKE